MRIFYNLFVVLITLTLLVGCMIPASEYYQGTKVQARGVATLSPELSSEKGRIWFYRDLPRTGAGLWPDITLDGLRVAESNPYEVYFVDVSPGMYEAGFVHKDFKLPIVVIKQQHVFVKSTPHLLTIMSQKTGEKDLGPFNPEPE